MEGVSRAEMSPALSDLGESSRGRPCGETGVGRVNLETGRGHWLRRELLGAWTAQWE